MTLSMNQAMYEKAKAGGVPYSTTIPVKNPVKFLKAVVYHFDTDLLGAVTTSVR